MTISSPISTGTTVEANIYAPHKFQYEPFKANGVVTYVSAHRAEESDGAFLEAIRDNLSRLWASDWDSDEDSAYDAW